MNAGRNALNNYLGGDSTALAPALEKVEKTPTLSDEADELREGLTSLLARARDIAQDKTLEADEREQRVKQLGEDLKTWDEQFNKWVETEGADFGIKMHKSEQTSDEQKD